MNYIPFIKTDTESIEWYFYVKTNKFLETLTLTSVILRRSNQMWYVKEGVIKNFANFTGKRLC